MSLLNNAIEAIEAIDHVGTITVRMDREGDDVVIEVADTGRGIPPADLKRGFDPGFTTKGRGVGTGLGLSTSYRTVQKHGGRLEIHSDGDAGTAAAVYLPIDGPPSVGAPT